ncbi:MAG: GAP family protein [Propionicimonas sp.]
MSGTVADVMLLSLGVAFSPVPIIAVVALLLSHRPRSAGLGFAGGWLAGIVAAVSAATVFARNSERLGVDPLQHAVALIGTVLGVVFVALGVVVWLRRPSGAQVGHPPWLAALDQLSVPRAVSAGVALSAVNPKNLLACVSAGLLLGWSGMPNELIVGSAAAFSLIAASTVLVPMLVFLIVGRAAGDHLATVRDWLIRHHVGVVALVMVAIGLLFVARGVSAA